MAVLSFVLSFILRKVGNILQLVFGWSVTALFGKLPQAKEILLTIALVLSLAWPFCVLGVVRPGVAAWAVAFLPIERWISAGVLRVLWSLLAVLTPAGVGLLVNAAVPSRRGGVLAAMTRGYPLAVAFFAAFLIVAVTVPIVKALSIARGWSEEHVYLQPRPGKYELVLRALAEAFARAGLVPEVTNAPRQMVLATTIMRTLARGAVAPLMTDELRRIRSGGLEIYLYPADLLLRGESKKLRGSEP